MKILAPVTFSSYADLQKNELRNAAIANLSSAPGTPVNGQIYFDTAANVNVPRVYDATATAWRKLLTYQVAAGEYAAASIVNADISASAAIAYSKLALTGAIVNADISGSAAIAYSKLNLSASIVNADIASGAAIAFSKIAAPAADFDMNSHKIVNVTDPTAAQDAATKAYVDATKTGLDIKDSCRVATAAALPAHTRSTNTLTASANAALTVDGVAVAVNDRVLVKDEGSGTHLENGIYKVTQVGSGAAPWILDRSTDADASAEVTAGLFTFVAEGTSNADNGYVLTTNDPITLNTTALTFVQFSGAGQITAGAGLTKTGNTIDVVGTANRIAVAADSIDISTSYVGQATITTLGTITTGVWTGTAIAVANGGTGATTAATARSNLAATTKYSSATHSSGTTITISAATHGCAGDRSNIVRVNEVSSGEEVYPDISMASNGDVTVTFAASVGANTYRVTIVG